MNRKAAFLLSLLASAVCQGYDPNYCPFEAGQRPASKATLCEVTYQQQSSDKDVSLYAVGAGTILVVRENDPNGGVTASLLEKGKVVGGPARLNGLPRLGPRVWTANLTSKNDAPKDVIIGTLSGGNALHASVYCVCFFLRSKDGYTATYGQSFHLDGNDFVDLNKDGQAEWIQTEFIYGCPGRDGKTHNYWVQNLIQFRDGRPTLASAVDKRFPSWIWFTYKPNHKNTVQLTAAQKQQLFREQAKGLEIYSAKSIAAGK